MDIKDFRTTKYNINSLILKRWSPRSINNQAVSDNDVMALFEAARWAPSAYNEQPWRFIYVKKGGPNWSKLLSALVEFNQDWAKEAAVLVLLLSKRTFSLNKQENQTASFDTGAAWENLALEAVSRGLVTHTMSGLDYDKMRQLFNIPEDYKLEAVTAIGRQGEKQAISEALQEKEFPSDRKDLADIISEGEFNF